MREFFRGWRRKLGVVTLVMACGFMAAWIRSLRTIDIGTLCLIQPHVVGITSTQRGIEFHYERNKPEMLGHRSGWYSYVRANPSDRSLESILQEMMLDTLWDSAVSPIPHWLIVLPLTLLSAWLLLSKQPPTKVNVQP